MDLSNRRNCVKIEYFCPLIARCIDLFPCLCGFLSGYNYLCTRFTLRRTTSPLSCQFMGWFRARQVIRKWAITHKKHKRVSKLSLLVLGHRKISLRLNESHENATVETHAWSKGAIQTHKLQKIFGVNDLFNCFYTQMYNTITRQHEHLQILSSVPFQWLLQFK